jgi:hypothetical protein
MVADEAIPVGFELGGDPDELRVGWHATPFTKWREGFSKPVGLKDLEPVLHWGSVENSFSEQGGSKWLESRDAMRIGAN